MPRLNPRLKLMPFITMVTMATMVLSVDILAMPSLPTDLMLPLPTPLGMPTMVMLV